MLYDVPGFETARSTGGRAASSGCTRSSGCGSTPWRAGRWRSCTCSTRTRAGCPRPATSACSPTPPSRPAHRTTTYGPCATTPAAASPDGRPTGWSGGRRGSQTYAVQPVVQVRLLGQLELRVDGTTWPPLESARAESLLAYLLLHRDAPQSRQRLAFALWPDSTESQARTNLRHVLHTLRRRLPDAERQLEITPRTLRWRSDARSGWTSPTSSALPADRNRGDDPDAPSAGWTRCAPRRRSTRATCWRAATTSGCLTSGSGCGSDDWTRWPSWPSCARPAASRPRRSRTPRGLLRADPLREPTYRLLMRCTTPAATGRGRCGCTTSAAPRWSASWACDPSAETRAAYEALLSREARGSGARAARRPGRRWSAARRASRPGSPPPGGPPRPGQARLVLVSGEPGVGQDAAGRGVPGLVRPARRRRRRRPLLPGRGRARLRPGRGLAALRRRCGRRAAAARPAAARPSWPGCCPSCSSSCRTSSARSRCRPSEQRRGCSTRWPPRCSPPGGRPAARADDLQHADRETCQLLHYLLRVRPDARGCWWLATARREEFDGDHPVHELLAGAARPGTGWSRSSWRRSTRPRPRGWPSGSPAPRSPSPTRRGCTPRPRATRCSSSRRCAPDGRAGAR